MEAQLNNRCGFYSNSFKYMGIKYLVLSIVKNLQILIVRDPQYIFGLS